LLSYLYGAVIVAIMVNSVGGLLAHWLSRYAALAARGDRRSSAWSWS